MELAARADEAPVPARVIAESQGIPMRFLEHQLAALHKAGLVSSQRGAAGGYVLAREPEEIRIVDVIEVLEGPLAPMFCLEPHEESCEQSHQCGLQDLWVRVEEAVRSVFERTSVADLVTRHRELQPLLWPVTMTPEMRRT
jgi:Rrf2 family protein